MILPQRAQRKMSYKLERKGMYLKECIFSIVILLFLPLAPGDLHYAPVVVNI